MLLPSLLPGDQQLLRCVVGELGGDPATASPQQHMHLVTIYQQKLAVNSTTYLANEASRRHALTPSCLRNICAQVHDAEQQVMDVLGSVKGRGTSGLDQQQLLELNAAIEFLEQDGGVSGE
jgi:hypothetical protein